MREIYKHKSYWQPSSNTQLFEKIRMFLYTNFIKRKTKEFTKEFTKKFTNVVGIHQ